MIIPFGCMNCKSCLTGSVFLLLCIPTIIFAAGIPNVYVSLIGIPMLGEDLTFGNYLNALYALSISVAALVAVIKIIIAGLKYMLSDVVTSKQDAISDIRGSLIGLIIVISAVLILTEINPQLVTTSVFIEPVQPPPAYTGPAAGGAGAIPGAESGGSNPALKLPTSASCDYDDVGGYNCTAQVAACTGEATVLNNNTKVLCRYGIYSRSICPSSPQGSDCTAKIAACVSSSGQWYKSGSPSIGLDLICIRPFN